MRKLLDYCTVSGISVKEFTGEKKYIATGDVIDNKIVSFENVDYKNKPSRANQVVKNGEVLFAKMKGTQKVLLIKDELSDNIYSTGFFVIKANENVLPEYLYWLFNSSKFNQDKDKNSKGATQQAINLEGLNKILIKEIPQLDEQRKIITEIEKTFDILELKKKQLMYLDELIKSQFVEMFGEININDKLWKKDILKNHLKVIGGYAFKSSDFKNSGIPILRIGNINAGYFKPKDLMFWSEEDKLKNYIIYPNDIVMSLTGTVGKDDYGNVCIMGKDYEKYYLNQRNAKLELKDTLDKIYISYALRVPEIKKRLTGISRGVRQANIANRDIESLEIPIPPIELQNKFADIVKQINKQKVEIQNSLEEMQKLQESLMNQYFGE